MSEFPEYRFGMVERPGDDAVDGAGSQQGPRRDRSTDVAVQASPGARAVALLVDWISMLVLSIIVMVVVWFATAPFVPSMTPDISAGGAPPEITGPLAGDAPVWVLALMALVLLVGVLGLSGALRDQGRTSLGLRASELEFADPRPARWRVAARWVVPVTLFLAIGAGNDAILAMLVVLLGWAPCLLGRRRSVYDWLAGLTVVDPTATRRRALADARQRSRSDWTQRN